MGPEVGDEPGPQSWSRARVGDGARGHEAELRNPLAVATGILRGSAACTKARFFYWRPLLVCVYCSIWGKGNADEKPKGNVLISLKRNSDLDFNKQPLFYLF